MEKLYTISEVADKLGLSTKTLRRWEETGKFVSNRTLGGQRRYSLIDLQILDAIKHGTIPDSGDLLTIEQAAALFGVTAYTLSRWEDEGKIHPLITAGQTFYPRHRLLEKIKTLQKSVSPDPISAPPPKEPTIPAPPIIPDLPPPTPPRPPSPLQSFGLNLLTTLLLLVAYHFLANRATLVPVSPAGKIGQVQGLSTNRDPSLTLLDSLLDRSGNLKSRSLTTPSLSLTPAVPPAHPVPGSIYFDAGSQSLKLYTNKWTDLLLPSTFLAGNNTIQVGSQSLLKGESSLIVKDPLLTPQSSVFVTFSSDYSPAKKFWVTPATGQFTLSTDFPVAQDSPFTYQFVGIIPL